MAEAAIQKKQGATKKAVGGAAPPVFLKDGKTPASESALARALGKYGLPVPETLAEKLAAVRAYLTKSFAEDPHVCTPACDDPNTSQCPRVVCDCKEVSTYSTDFCPFCGDLGLPQGAPVGNEQSVPLVQVAAPAPVEMTEPASDDAPAEEPVSEPPQEPSQDTSLPDGDDSDALAPHLEVLPSGPVDKVAALDASVARIEELKLNWAQNTYDLAAELKKVQDDQLFLARGYENFGAWAMAEVKLSRTVAYDLAKVAGEFDRETYLAVGVSKLRLVSGIEDPQARAEALADAKAGASTRTLERAHAAPRNAPAPESGKGRVAPAPEPVKPREAPKKGQEIVLLAKVNGRATTHPFVSSKTNREIKQYAEDAYVELRLADNVVLHAAPKFGPDGKTLVGLTVKFVETIDPA